MEVEVLEGFSEAYTEDDQVEATGDADSGAFDAGVGPEAEPPLVSSFYPEKIIKI